MGWGLILAAIGIGLTIPLPIGTPLFLIGFAMISLPGKRRLASAFFRRWPKVRRRLRIFLRKRGLRLLPPRHWSRKKTARRLGRRGWRGRRFWICSRDRGLLMRRGRDRSERDSGSGCCVASGINGQEIHGASSTAIHRAKITHNRAMRRGRGVRGLTGCCELSDMEAQGGRAEHITLIKGSTDGRREAETLLGSFLLLEPEWGLAGSQ